MSNTQALAIEDAMGRPCVGLRFLGFNGQTSGIYVLSVDDIEGIIDMLRTQATTARTFDGYTEEAAARIAKREVRCPGCKRVLFGKRKILGTCTECAAVSSEQEVVPGV